MLQTSSDIASKTSPPVNSNELKQALSVDDIKSDSNKPLPPKVSAKIEASKQILDEELPTFFSILENQEFLESLLKKTTLTDILQVMEGLDPEPYNFESLAGLSTMQAS